jgi:hypothetical protein
MDEIGTARRLPRRLLLVFLLIISTLYLIEAFYYARTLIPAQDGVNFLALGAKAVRGEMGVFDDRVVGNRLPLPFYVLGLSQVAGPSFRAARWLNIGWGLLALWLTIGLARRLAGDVAGVLAGLFLVTQGVVVAYYSYEGYPAFAAFCVAAALFALADAGSPGRRILGTALVGLLFLVRSNLWPLIPLALGYSLWRARGLRERALLSALVVVTPIAFFASDRTHLKLLAYVPVFRRLVAPLGYVSALVLDDRQILGPRAQLWELARIIRRYEFWALAFALMVIIVLWRVVTKRPIDRATEAARPIGLILAGSVAALFVMYPWNFRWIGLYFVPYTPLAAAVLGMSYAGLMAGTEARSWQRYLLVGALICMMLPPLYFVRNPLLPIGEVLEKDPYGASYRAAAHLRAVVPGTAKVFFYGLNEVYYLSGLPQTYFQQVYLPDQFPKIAIDDRVARRSGFVTRSEMRYWLSRDADYAVIDLTLVEAMQPRFGETEREMMDLLTQHFELIDTVRDYPFSTYLVYRRRAGDR